MTYTLQQIIELQSEQLEADVFVLAAAQNHPSPRSANSRQATLKYFKVSVRRLNAFDSEFCVVKITDFTISIEYDVSLGEKRLLELVNACVSHEMRNPINAMLGTSIHLRDIVQRAIIILRSN